MSAPLKLRNIGPKSAAWLRQVGLRTPEDLAAAGPVEAFMRVKRAGFKPSLNLLYALEGALIGCHWQQVPEDRRHTLIARKEKDGVYRFDIKVQGDDETVFFEI